MNYFYYQNGTAGRSFQVQFDSRWMDFSTLIIRTSPFARGEAKNFFLSALVENLCG